MDSKEALIHMKAIQDRISKVHCKDYCGLSIIKECKEVAENIHNKYKNGCGEYFRIYPEIKPTHIRVQCGNTSLLISDEEQEIELCPNCNEIKKIFALLGAYE